MPTSSSLATPQAVVMTTRGSISDENVGIVTTLRFRFLEAVNVTTCFSGSGKILKNLAIGTLQVKQVISAENRVHYPGVLY